MSLRLHHCAQYATSGYRIACGSAWLLVLLSGCATLLKPIETRITEPPVVKVDGTWTSNPPLQSTDPFERQPLPPDIETRLLRNQPPEAIAAATAPRSTPVKAASAAPAAAPIRVAPPVASTSTSVPAVPNPTASTTASAVDVQREQELSVLAQKATTAVAERRKPVAAAASRSTSKPQPLQQSSNVAQLIGLIEDSGGGSIAILQIPGSGMQRARLGDTIHLPIEGQDTSMRVGAIENGQVVLTTADNSRTVVIR